MLSKRAPFTIKNGKFDADNTTKSIVYSLQQTEINLRDYIDSTRIPYKRLKIIAELLK